MINLELRHYFLFPHPPPPPYTQLLILVHNLKGINSSFCTQVYIDGHAAIFLIFTQPLCWPFSKMGQDEQRGEYFLLRLSLGALY